MKTAKDIQSAITNIKYYSDRIEMLTRQQLDAYCSISNCHPDAQSILLDKLGYIARLADLCKQHCDRITTEIQIIDATERLIHESPNKAITLEVQADANF